MKHASLFTGIGGFDLAAEWMGWENVFQVEIDDFCQKVLKYYWPNAKRYTDIRTVDFTIWKGKIDILSGGPPCQPVSFAGKRKGTSDDRWLWPETFRAVREIEPKYAVFENPTGILSLENGRLFTGILSALENEGYQTECFIIPACSLQAPHKRDRLWIITYCTDARTKSMQQKRQNRIYEPKITSDASSIRRIQGEQTNASKFVDKTISNWQNWPTQSPVCGGNDGISCKLDGITFPRWRRESIKAFGNAIVPQVAFEIFKAIKIVENED